MKTIATKTICLTLLGLLLQAGAALADNAGTIGRIVGFQHNDPISSDFIEEGRIYVDEGGGSLRQYKWGGSWCPNRDLDLDQQSLLLDAMRSKFAVLPYWKTGNGGVRCLIAFVFAPKAATAAQIQE